MLAARLCKSWGIADVKAFHHAQSKEVMDLWQAFDSIEPIGEERMQTAMVCELISFACSLMLSKVGVKSESRTAEDYMGGRYVKPKKPIEKPVEQDFTAIAKAIAGVG